MELGHLDYVIIAVLLISASLSLIRGFTKEVLSITGWIVSGYAAIFFGPSAQTAARRLCEHRLGGQWRCHAARLPRHADCFLDWRPFIAKSMKASPLGPLDRTLGIIFGGLRGVFIVCMAYLGISAVIPEDDHPDFIKDAKLRPMLQTGTKSRGCLRAA